MLLASIKILHFKNIVSWSLPKKWASLCCHHQCVIRVHHTQCFACGPEMQIFFFFLPDRLSIMASFLPLFHEVQHCGPFSSGYICRFYCLLCISAAPPELSKQLLLLLLLLSMTATSLQFSSCAVTCSLFTNYSYTLCCLSHEIQTEQTNFLLLRK